MEEIRDAEGRLLCYGDAFQGLLESSYKKQAISIHLPVGGEVVFDRENVTTLIARRTPSQFYVYSEKRAAQHRTMI